MVRSGADSIRVQQLARDLHATKGSFYWHFRDRAALLDAILQRWCKVTVDPNHLLETEEPDPVQRLLRLLHLLHLPEQTRTEVAPADFELAVRAWARHSARAGAAVREVDRLREKLFVRMFRQLSALGTQATTLAHICLAITGRVWKRHELRRPWRLSVIETTRDLLIGACVRRRGRAPARHR
jgi:AcrR family transcriptional regulator